MWTKQNNTLPTLCQFHGWQIGIKKIIAKAKVGKIHISWLVMKKHVLQVRKEDGGAAEGLWVKNVLFQLHNEEAGFNAGLAWGS